MSHECPEVGISQERNQSDLNPHSTFATMFLWFMGASWVSKFCGEGGVVVYDGWRAQVEAFLRAQNLYVQQKVDFLLSTLEGKARRQVMLLAPEHRDNELKILSVLAKKCGSIGSPDQLRADFFDCKQTPGEGIEDFILCLCESFNRWQSRDPANVGPMDGVLRAQFARGLKDGPTKRELQRELRRATPPLSFEAACEEARALEREFARGEDTMACQTRVVPPSRPTSPAFNIEQLKESLRTKMRLEIKEQVTLLGKPRTEELRS